jgi:hypothetical protein
METQGGGASMAIKVNVVGAALVMMAGSAQAQAQGPAAQPSPVAQPAPVVPPPGYAQPAPPPGYAQPAPPPREYVPYSPYVPAPVSPSPLGRGATFEANLGVGWLRATADSGESADSDGGLGGLNLGLGGWISERTALSLRIAGVNYSESGYSLTGGIVGGALQYWSTPNFWLGGGVGIGFASLDIDGEPAIDPETGLGLDLRVGVTPVIAGQHSLNFSLEVNTTFLDGGTLTGIALLIGYQYL